MDEFYDWQIPGTWVEIYDEIFLPAFIGDWATRLADRVSLQPGRRALDVACGSGALAILKLQRAGGRVIDAADYVNGRPELKR